MIKNRAEDVLHSAVAAREQHQSIIQKYCLVSHLVPSHLCVRAFARGIAAGRMELLEQAAWVPTEFIEQALRVATGTLSRSLSLPAVISDTRSLF